MVDGCGVPMCRSIVGSPSQLQLTPTPNPHSFPRTIPQAEALEKHLKIDVVVNLDIPDQTIIERISNRWIHAPSGRTYAYDYNPPKKHGVDDVTGACVDVIWGDGVESRVGQ